jgi:hypothetical protein
MFAWHGRDIGYGKLKGVTAWKFGVSLLAGER